MGIVIRQSLLSTLISYAGVVIGFFNVAYLFPRFFSLDQIGLRSVLMELPLLLAQVSLLGFTGVTNKFFPYFRDPEKNHNGFLFLILSIPFAGFLLSSGILFIFRDALIASYQKSSPLVLDYIFLIFPITFFVLYSMLMEVLIAYHNAAVSNFIREILLRLLTALIIFLYVMHWIDIRQFWYLFVASYGLATVLLFIYFFRKDKVSFAPDFRLLNKDMRKEIMAFAFFGLFTGAATMIVLKIDTVMISYMLDLPSTAIYALAIYITSIIEIPRKNISQVVNPLISTAWKENDLEKIKQVYQKSALNQLIIGGFLFLLLWLNIESIFHFIPQGQAFMKGRYVIFFVGIAKVFDMATGLNGEIIGYSKYYKFGFYSVIVLAVLTVAGNYALIPQYGITGAAIAMAFSMFIYNILKFIFLLTKYRMQPFNSQTIKVLATASVICILIYFLPVPKNHLLSIILKSMVLGFLTILAVLYLNISKEIKETLLKLQEKINLSGK
jgi:O-antigen/teichoic acid export membrane protein